MVDNKLYIGGQGGRPGKMERNVHIVACNEILGEASRYDGKYKEERRNNDASYQLFWDNKVGLHLNFKGNG